ncbi:MAG: ABC transporter permease [candidate division Zixibacteria bacterium]|nr:ABC transporter permease [candidate division Zixibacteria bacterium]
MRLRTIIWKELWLRKSQLISALLGITLGIAVIVGIQSVATVSEKAVKVSLDNLGANILVLPQAASVDDYYSADIDAPTFPEEYVERLATSMLPGVDNLSPKLTRRLKIKEIPVILTGILPANELASKPIWQTAGLIGPGLDPACDPKNSANQSFGYQDERLQRKAIDSLAVNDILVGSVIAQRLNLRENDILEMSGRSFTVARVIPETGTIDDNRIYAHLHTVQQALGTGNQVSAIEIMGCCSAISDGLLGKLRNILPDTRITTINQIVSTQIKTNQLMSKISLVFLVIIILVGAITIGNYMWANVEERRREIGILITVGTRRSIIYRMFLTKAVILGLVGGIIGYILGTGSAMILGPQLAGLKISPVPIYLLLSVIVAVLISLMGSILPVRRASRFDPAVIMQEV